jgi:hypothetical protein
MAATEKSALVVDSPEPAGQDLQVEPAEPGEGARIWKRS